MSAETALEKYTKAVQNIKDHIEANSAVFTTHKALLMQQMDAENELRDIVAETMQSISNNEIAVKVVKQSQTFADIPTLDEWVKNGEITQAMRDKAVKTIDRPPHISIKELKPRTV